MRYLITGGAGFIGSNIAATLVSKGEDVRIIDDFSSGRRENLDNIKNDIELIEGSITDRRMVDDVMSGVDVVLHHAAIPSVVVSVEDPVGSTDVNIGGTVNILDAARNNNVKRFVFASSAAVYGDLPDLPKSEKSELKPLSPYAAAKLTGEYYCKIYYELYDLETVCLRYFNVFGPNQDPKSEYAAVIPNFINALLTGNNPRIYGDGLQTRDFVSVRNVVNANLAAVQSKDAVGESINVACGEKHTLLDLLNVLKDLIDSDVDHIFEAEKPGDIKHSLAAIDKARKLLGYSLEQSFEDGLRETTEYFRRYAGGGIRAGK